MTCRTDSVFLNHWSYPVQDMKIPVHVFKIPVFSLWHEWILYWRERFRCWVIESTCSNKQFNRIRDLENNAVISKSCHGRGMDTYNGINLGKVIRSPLIKEEFVMTSALNCVNCLFKCRKRTRLNQAKYAPKRNTDWRRNTCICIQVIFGDHSWHWMRHELV